MFKIMSIKKYDELVNDNFRLQSRVSYLEERINLPSGEPLPPLDLSASFDFAAKSAFSIEREKSTSRTVIGFIQIDSDGDETNEYWYASTTDEIHRQLVEEFNIYVKQRPRHQGNADQ